MGEPAPITRNPEAGQCSHPLFLLFNFCRTRVDLIKECKGREASGISKGRVEFTLLLLFYAKSLSVDPGRNAEAGRFLSPTRICGLYSVVR